MSSVISPNKTKQDQTKPNKTKRFQTNPNNIGSDGLTRIGIGSAKVEPAAFRGNLRLMREPLFYFRSPGARVSLRGMRFVKMRKAT
jgi:hypothetical protein